MLVAIRIDLGIDVVSAEGAPELLDLDAVAGEVEPLRIIEPGELAILRQLRGGIDGRIDRDREDPDAIVELLRESPANLDQVLGDARSDPRAGRVHELNHHDAITHEILVEAVGLPVARNQLGVGKAV